MLSKRNYNCNLKFSSSNIEKQMTFILIYFISPSISKIFSFQHKIDVRIISEILCILYFRLDLQNSVYILYSLQTWHIWSMKRPHVVSGYRTVLYSHSVGPSPTPAFCTSEMWHLECPSGCSTLAGPPAWLLHPCYVWGREVHSNHKPWAAPPPTQSLLPWAR